MLACTVAACRWWWLRDPHARAAAAGRPPGVAPPSRVRGGGAGRGRRGRAGRSRARVTPYGIHRRPAAPLAESEDRLAALDRINPRIVTDAMLAEERPEDPAAPPTAGAFFALTGGSCWTVAHPCPYWQGSGRPYLLPCYPCLSSTTTRSGALASSSPHGAAPATPCKLLTAAAAAVPLGTEVADEGGLRGAAVFGSRRGLTPRPQLAHHHARLRRHHRRRPAGPAPGHAGRLLQAGTGRRRRRRLSAAPDRKCVSRSCYLANGAGPCAASPRCVMFSIKAAHPVVPAPPPSHNRPPRSAPPPLCGSIGAPPAPPPRRPGGRNASKAERLRASSQPALLV